MPEFIQGASTTSSSISLIKTIVGAGLLSVPLAFSTDGIIGGLFFVFLAAATAGYGLFLQAYVSKYVAPGHASFFNVCSITYPMLSVVFDLAIAIQCFGCAVSYLVLIGDLMPTIIKSVPFVSEENLRVFWIFASSLVCVPICFLKNLDSLKYTSILALGAIVYICLLVVFEQIRGHVPSELRGEIHLTPPSLKGVFSTFPIIVFAFTGHQNMFSIINEARNKSLASLVSLIKLAMACSFALFVIVGLNGYLTFGNLVSGNVVLSYPGSWWTQFGRFAIVFMVVFSFPLMFHPARMSVNNIYYWVTCNVFNKSNPEPVTTEGTENTERTALLNEAGLPQSTLQTNVVPFSNKTFCVITITLLVFAYYFAVTLESFALVLAIVGATGSTSISFILPGLFGYKLIGSETNEPSRTEKILRFMSLLLIVWGFAVMIVCLYASLAL